MDFEVSATNLGGLIKALGSDAAQLHARVSPATKAVLQNPHAQRWHPGAVAVETWSATIDVFGGPRFEALNLALTRQSFGPIVTPLLRVTLALGGSSPASVFSRLNDAIKVATRNVTVTWKASSSQSGAVTFEYPLSLPRSDFVEFGWRGAMRFGDELTGKRLVFGAFVADSDRRFTFPVSW